jgi:hypothetical protein
MHHLLLPYIVCASLEAAATAASRTNANCSTRQLAIEVTCSACVSVPAKLLACSSCCVAVSHGPLLLLVPR